MSFSSKPGTLGSSLLLLFIDISIMQGRENVNMIFTLISPKLLIIKALGGSKMPSGESLQAFGYQHNIDEKKACQSAPEQLS